MGADGEPRYAPGRHPNSRAGQFGHGRPVPKVLPQDAAEPEPLPELVAVEGEGLLAAMRHVLANPDKRLDATEEQRQCRGWLADNRDGFFRERAKLEAAELVAKGRAADRAEAAAAEDVGSQTVLGLVDELIAKFKESRH